MAQGPETDLLAVVSELSFARDLPTVTAIVRRAARRLTNADGVTFVLKDGAQCYYADEDAIAPLWKGRRFPLESCISGWVMIHREPAAIPDIYQDARIPHDAYRPTFVKSLLMVPVRREQPIAAIGAYWAAAHEATDDERRVLEVLAQASSLALANVQLWTDLEHSLAREQQARREAEDARAAAENANRLKDQFLATVSHELRTPLNVMQGWLWQLRQRPVDAERMQKALATLERNTALQIRLVEDLLDVSRAAAGRLTLDAKLLDLAGVAQVVVEVAQPSAEAKGVTLTFAADAAPALVLGDVDRLQQVLWNLASNAIKFTPSGGSVDVAVGRAGSKAVITVRDSGIGMSAEFLPFAFDQFRQADATPTRHYGGLGIGLTIVQQLVRLHGGTVAAESAGQGRGTTVRVELPVPAVTAEPGDWLRRRVGGARHTGASLAGFTLLVIDDEPEACEALREVLEHQGATVHVAGSAEEGLALAMRITPSLIVADLSMPGTDGFAFLREFRQRSGVAAEVPAAALTAMSGPDYERMAAAAGYQLFLQKPISPDELTFRLADLIKGFGRQVH